MYSPFKTIHLVQQCSSFTIPSIKYHLLKSSKSTDILAITSLFRTFSFQQAASLSLAIVNSLNVLSCKVGDVEKFHSVIQIIILSQSQKSELVHCLSEEEPSFSSNILVFIYFLNLDIPAEMHIVQLQFYPSSESQLDYDMNITLPADGKVFTSCCPTATYYSDCSLG